jgi:hypothetical protein
MQARSRAFPPKAVFGPAFTPGSPPDQDLSLSLAGPCQPRLRGSCLFAHNGQEPRKRG